MVPTTRIQAYLSRIAGNDTYLPPPITQEEIYLKQIAEQERRQQVEPNPVLAGGEPELTSLTIGGVKFKVASSQDFYQAVSTASYGTPVVNP